MVTHEVELQPRVGDYRRVLRKHRWLITGIFLLAVLTVAIWTFLQVPIYQAVATILIEPEPPSAGWKWQLPQERLLKIGPTSGSVSTSTKSN